MSPRKKGSSKRKASVKKINFGWMPDLPDHRDVLYGVVRRVPAKLPKSADLRPMCSSWVARPRRAWAAMPT